MCAYEGGSNVVQICIREIGELPSPFPRDDVRYLLNFGVLKLVRQTRGDFRRTHAAIEETLIEEPPVTFA